MLIGYNSIWSASRGKMKFDAKRIFKRFKGSEGSEGKVLKIDRPWGRRVLKFDSPCGAEGCGGAPGHTFGVRVHRVQKVQRVVVAASPQFLKGR